MINFFKKRWYLTVILVLIAVIIFSASKKNKSSAEDSYIVKKQNLKEVLTLSGEIDVQEKATLKFQTSGRLVWVGVKEGDYVKKYQTIASLDQRDIKNRLEKYLRTYSIARSNFDQTKDDNWNKQYDLNETTRVKAQRILEQNQYNLESAVLDVEYQNLALENANLWTPIEGVVTRIDVPIAGVNTTPANATFEVVNPKTLYFSSTIEQADVVKIKEGIKGRLTLDSFENFNDEVKVNYISFSPKQGETGTVYQVKIDLTEKTKKLPLRLGMTGDVEFILKEKNNVLAVPSRFVKNDKKGSYVYVKENNKKVKKYVVLGDEIDGKMEIVDGLKADEVVLN